MVAIEESRAQPRPHLLIVDDVPENIEVLAAALGADCEIFFAISGEEAIEIALNHRIDLILLDIMMPDVDGYEICRLLKLEPQLAEIPVIFVTAKTDTEDEARGFAVGGVDYITKPIKRLTVRARVNTHLQLKASRDRLRELAYLDGPAGMPGRSTFDQLLERETRRAELERQPLSVLLVGIDAFAALSKAQGLLASQRQIERVGEVLATVTEGPLDLCAHYGGPQFAVLLPQADADAASQHAGVLMDAVATIETRVGGSKQRLTASVGGVSADFALLDAGERVRAQELALAASQALEEASAGGRSQLWLRRWEPCAMRA
jgi:diguanylate cyclase (GGDEF)-like protein